MNRELRLRCRRHSRRHSSANHSTRCCARKLGQQFPPPFRVRGRRGAKSDVVAHLKGSADETFAGVAAANVEAVGGQRTDGAIWEMEGEIRGRIAAVVVGSALVLVQEASGSEGVVGAVESGEASEGTTFPLKGSGEERSSRGMVLIRIADMSHRSRRSGGIDHETAVAVEKVHPFKLERDALGGGGDVGIQDLLAIALTSKIDETLADRLLYRLNDVCLEALKVLLRGNQLAAVVIFLDDLLVEPILHFALQHIGIILRLEFASTGTSHSSMLTQKLDVLLRIVARRGHGLGAFDQAIGHLLETSLDLLMESTQDRQDLAGQSSGRIEM